jgi:hypothetical protein
MTKKFSQLLQEEFDKYCFEEGLFSSPEIEKLTEEVLKIIDKKVERHEITTPPKSFKTVIFLTSPLSSEETSEVKKALERFNYTNSVEIFDDTQLWLEPKYPINLNVQKPS